MIRRLALIVALFAALPALAAAKAPTVVPDAMASQMSWRLLGPHRGGWAEMVDGSALRPETFVMASAGGGVWRTDNAGRTWTSLFDKGPTSAVGAVAMAPSNPDVIYAGTGQPTPRYDVARGAGVFRSSDSGKTWTDLGLHGTYAIGRIVVDPTNPDKVLVAAVGHFFGPNPERGVFRSTDGGKTWSHALKIDADTGAVDLAMDPTNPQVVFASSWQARQYPWQSYFTPINGPGSALWRSDDGGATFRKVGGEGWPAGPLGHITVALTHTASGALRVYSVVSSGDRRGGAHDGLYRSDNGGAHWMRVNDELAFTGYYAGHVAVAPNDPDTVYLVGQSIRRCDQGGARCEIIRGAPGGDDYHFIWLNPKDPSHWASASDQGVAITVDGGRTFSSWYNQPTGQFYHLAVDNQFPYKVYSGQQDSGTVGLSSRSDYGPPNFRDWRPVGAEERDYDIPDPEDPKIVYGTGLGGKLEKFDARTGAVADISPYLEPNYGQRQTTTAHRFVWVTPLAVSRTGPVTLYLGAEVVFKSTDRGMSWTIASPDLTGKTADARGCDGDVTPAQARPCGFGGIWSMAASARHAGELWVGTDSGLVQMTRDDGAHWTNVTPPGIPAWAKIASVDVSDAEDGTAYIAIDNQRQDDFSARAMVTHDYGATWREIGAGLPAGQFVAAVRGDTVKPGLVFAGTETGVFVSFDDGAHWSSLQKNLPTAWVRDLNVHGNDLIAATQGRAIWILDDLSPLRQMTAALATEPAHLFHPADAYRLRPNNNKDTPLPQEEPTGENPPDGAVIDYWLGKAATSVSLEIRDASGALVQTLTDQPADKLEAERYFNIAWLPPEQRLSTAPGLHRAQWNLRWTRPQALSYDYSISASVGRGTALTPGGPYALPGAYTATLKVDGKVVGQQSFHLVTDPRTAPDRAGLEASLALSRDITGALATARRVLGEAQAVRAQLAAPATAPPAVIATSAAATGPAGWISATDGLKASATMLAGIETSLEGADVAPTAPQRAAADAAMASIRTLSDAWRARLKAELPGINALRVKAKLKPVTVPDGERVELAGAAGGVDLP